MNSTDSPAVACARGGCIFPVPAIRVRDRSRFCSAACAHAERRAKTLRRKPSYRGARDLTAFVAALNDRDSVAVENGLDIQSLRIIQARDRLPKNPDMRERLNSTAVA